jgi:hypothetical protein
MNRLNVGNPDRALRVIFGIVLLALAVSGTIGAWGYIGIIALLTGDVAYCPLYSMLGMSTTSR